MEENKYYTPSLEEFCIGFEYEQINPVPIYDNGWRFKITKRIFTKEDIRSTMDLYRITIDLQDKDIRVKYLDQQDIEECGFKENGYEEFIMTNSNIKSRYSTICTEVRIELYYDYKTKELSILYQPEYLFNGTIKNKTELKKLLKQLNIV